MSVGPSMRNAFTMIKRHWCRSFSVGLYLMNSFCLVVGAAMLAMKPSDWHAMSGMNKVGWGLLLAGNVSNTWKAATSQSAKKESGPGEN